MGGHNHVAVRGGQNHLASTEPTSGPSVRGGSVLISRAMPFGTRPKAVKHCPEGHVMQMSWRTCPRCTGRTPQDAQPGRDMVDLTIVEGAPPPPAAPPPVSAHRGVALLVAESGPAQGKEFEILQGRWKIGRSPRTQDGFELVAIKDPGMSRDHFALEAGQAAVVLRDLGSTNGTLVNGSRVERHILQEGDVVRAGETSLRVRLFVRS